MLKMAKVFSGNSHICEGSADVKRKQRDDNGMKDLINDLGKVTHSVIKAVFPFLFPRMEERHSPMTKARATAERVSMTGSSVIEKNGVRDASAVAAI